MVWVFYFKNYPYICKKISMINKDLLKELASTEMQLGMSKYPDICLILSLKEFKENTDRMQWRKHILMEIEKVFKILLGISLLMCFFLYGKLGFTITAPFLINVIITLITRRKIKNNISMIRSNLYHVSYVDIIVDKWVNELKSNGFFNHIEPKELLEKRDIKNYYIDNESVFDEKYFGGN